MTPTLHIVTLALRLDGALRAAESVAAAAPSSPWPLRHVIAWHRGEPDRSFASNAATINRVFAELPAEDWLVFVDDDNLLHPELPAALAACAEATGAGAVMLGMQYRPGVYFPAAPDRLTPGFCDGGQLAVRPWVARGVRWPAGPTGDGEYLRDLYALAPELWAFLDRPLTFHNAQEWL